MLNLTHRSFLIKSLPFRLGLQKNYPKIAQLILVQILLLKCLYVYAFPKRSLPVKCYQMKIEVAT